MKSSYLLAAFSRQPWAMMPEQLHAMSALLLRMQATRNGIEAPAQIEAYGNDARARAAAKPGRPTSGSIAVIPVRGPVLQRISSLDDILSCATGLDSVTQSLRQAMADDTISQVLLDIDSPGGSVYGTGELAAEIYASRSTKPIIGIANSLAASAAYWIGSACNELYVTPGGEVGSIGVWTAHDDVSAMLEQLGVKTTLVSAGQYKTEGNPYQPLDADAQAYMQSRVDDYYNAFVKGVAKGRGVGVDQVRDGMGQGRVLGAAQAKDAKMVDDVGTIDDVLSMMAKRAKQPNLSKSASVSAIARSLEI